MSQVVHHNKKEPFRILNKVLNGSFLGIFWYEFMS